MNARWIGQSNVLKMNGRRGYLSWFHAMQKQFGAPQEGALAMA